MPILCKAKYFICNFISSETTSFNPFYLKWCCFPGAQTVKNPPAKGQTWVQSLGWEDPLEEGMATHSSILAWRIPMDRGAWLAAVHGVAKRRIRLSDFTLTFHFPALEKEMATHSSVLAWRIQGHGSLVGCRLWGRTESDTTEAT